VVIVTFYYCSNGTAHCVAVKVSCFDFTAEEDTHKQEQAAAAAAAAKAAAEPEKQLSKKVRMSDLPCVGPNLRLALCYSKPSPVRAKKRPCVELDYVATIASLYTEPHSERT
jgi:hypothetical protein